MKESPDATYKNLRKADPLSLIIHLLLAGIVILFLGFSYAYIFSDNQDRWEEFHLPKILWLSTAAILAVSYFLSRVLYYYKTDVAGRMKFNLLLALFCSLIFISCQVTGFLQLQNKGFTMQISPSSAYMFLLAGLHGLHILAGILFLIVAVIRLYFNTRDDVKRLIYFSDESKRIRLILLTHYWHTIDFLWVFLFLLFLYQHA